MEVPRSIGIWSVLIIHTRSLLIIHTRSLLIHFYCVTCAVREQESQKTPTSDAPSNSPPQTQHSQQKQQGDGAGVAGESCDTVGAVAIDVHGNVAAATSTGGLSCKWPGRVGDTPCVGVAPISHYTHSHSYPQIYMYLNYAIKVHFQKPIQC